MLPAAGLDVEGGTNTPPRSANSRRGEYNAGMTENEWLTCTDPAPMLDHLEGKVDERTLRRFACGCCRRIWELLTDERLREAVTLAEQGLARRDCLDHLDRAKGLASAALRNIEEDASEQRWYYVYRYAAEVVCLTMTDDLTVNVVRRVAELAKHASSLARPRDEASHSEREAQAQAELLRDVVDRA